MCSKEATVDMLKDVAIRPLIKVSSTKVKKWTQLNVKNEELIKLQFTYLPIKMKNIWRRGNESYAYAL